MIHVDVGTDKSQMEADPDVLVQTSVDGGPWKTQYIFPVTYPDPLQSWEDARKLQRREAENAARIFVNGCRFAGAEVRATSFGYAL